MEESKSAGSGAPVLDLTTGEKNPRGIPEMKFIEDVGALMESQSTTVEQVLQVLNQMHSKYSMMESHFAVQQKEMKIKLPEIEKSISIINKLQEKKISEETMKAQFSLTDNVFASATVAPVDRVCLWLGANVMLEYTYDEALTMLKENQVAAKAKIAELQDDLDYLKDALITTQVNLARVFNHDVKMRRLAKAGK